MNTKIFIVLLSLVLLGGLTAIGLSRGEMFTPEPHVNSKGEAHELTVYKDPNCGCCANWVTYMKAKGYKMEVIDTTDMDSVKSEEGVPEQLLSCHTTIINDDQYFVEGHIPEAAIVKLMEDEPDINGIGMPGMPSASPGMPGEKMAPFDISQVSKDGKVTNYLSI